MRTANIIAFLACLASLASSSTIHVKQESRAVVSLERRVDNARLTFYNVGLGACGKVNVGSDFVVALNAAQYDGGSHCFQEIIITVGSKSHSAQIVDECPGCPFGGLDLSRGLFDFFAPEEVGLLTGSWEFVDGTTASVI